jgi:hypothetical protein
LEYINSEERHPACVYFHPWEMDPEQPRVVGRSASWWRHSVGLAGMARKIEKLLDDFEFAPLGDVLRSVVGGNGQFEYVRPQRDSERTGCLQI